MLEIVGFIISLIILMIMGVVFAETIVNKIFGIKKKE